MCWECWGNAPSRDGYRSPDSVFKVLESGTVRITQMPAMLRWGGGPAPTCVWASFGNLQCRYNTIHNYCGNLSRDETGATP